MIDPAIQRLIAARKALARLGIYTFLTYGVDSQGLCACGRVECPSIGKHPRIKGNKWGATIDFREIEDQTTHPLSNIAVHCGLSKFVVIDIDPRNGGRETIGVMEREHGLLDSPIIVNTGGGGEHRYFRAQEGVSYPSTLGPGIDVQSGNKYVIMPPSRHASKREYRWRNGHDLDNLFLLVHLPDIFLPKRDLAPNENLPELDEDEGNIAHLKSALDAISADCSRSEWRDILFAIHSTGWSCAEELAREWSQTAMHLWSETEFDNIWNSSSPDRDGGRTVRSIYYEATRSGWIDPRGEKHAETLGDIDNGQRFAAANRGKLLYDRASKKWREYQNGIWRMCDKGQEVAAAKRVADTNLREAGANLSSNPTDASKASYNQALKVHRAAQRVIAMIDMAKAEPGMSVADPTAFDRDPLLLGAEGGAIDLRTGKWLPPLPSRKISKSVGVPYDSSAQCPNWKSFLREILANEQEVQFLQRFIGYSLTGLVDEEVFLFMQGAGANGKSVLANVLANVFGDYAVTVGSELLAVTKSEGEASRFKHRLCGARLVLVNEVGISETFNDQRVKEIVSREAIATRALYGEAFDFLPTHTIYVRGNHRPAIRDAGDGMWRRLILLPFNRQFAPHERVRDLDRILIEKEGSGILNWIIEGCLSWQKMGLQIPPSIAKETAIYRNETDVIGEWLDSECELEPEARCNIPTIFVSYQNFFGRMGMTPMTRPAFVRMMGTRGFRRKKSNGNAYLIGIDLRLGGL